MRRAACNGFRATIWRSAKQNTHESSNIQVSNDVESCGIVQYGGGSTCEKEFKPPSAVRKGAFLFSEVWLHGWHLHFNDSFCAGAFIRE
jgi:hypothetical protein